MVYSCFNVAFKKYCSCYLKLINLLILTSILLKEENSIPSSSNRNPELSVWRCLMKRSSKKKITDSLINRFLYFFFFSEFTAFQKESLCFPTFVRWHTKVILLKTYLYKKKKNWKNWNIQLKIKQNHLTSVMIEIPAGKFGPLIWPSESNCLKS